MKKKMLAVVLVVSLMVETMACLGVYANEYNDIQNENTIKYIKSEENYDYGNTAYIIRDKETKQIIPLSVVLSMDIAMLIFRKAAILRLKKQKNIQRLLMIWVRNISMIYT